LYIVVLPLLGLPVSAILMGSFLLAIIRRA